MRPGLRRIHVFHGNVPLHAVYGDLDHPLRERARRIVAYGLAERRSARFASVVVATSEANQDEVHRLYRVRRSVLIENAVDVELFRPRERLAARTELGLDHGRRYALFAGRLEARKGADLLEPACAAAGYELLVAGRDAPRHGTHLGLLQPDRLAVAYAAADCVLFPTRYEACSFVVLEALASGVPLVTTEVAWMRSFVQRMPEYRRLLVEPNVESIASRLRALSSEAHRELVEQASAHVRSQHALDAWSRAWLRLVDEIMDGVDLGPY